jgi:hypothetical protein
MSRVGRLVRMGRVCKESRAKYDVGTSEEYKMIYTRSFVISISLAMFMIPLGYAQDLSRYRDLRLGMDLTAVAEQGDIKASEVRLICQRPAVLQELEWQYQNRFSSSPQTDPVNGILLDFYNGELFRILVSYNPYRTEGLTDEDIIESISAEYGTPTGPTGTISVYSSSHLSSQDETIIAHWEDSQYSLNLFRSGYKSTPGMLIFSKRLEPIAQAAMVEASRLDAQEAPQREIDRQRKQDEEKRINEQKVRPANRANFRP